MKTENAKIYEEKAIEAAHEAIGDISTFNGMADLIEGIADHEKEQLGICYLDSDIREAVERAEWLLRQAAEAYRAAAKRNRE
jgi:hypothetical protein